MSVVGIDFGNANNIVALARRKGIDVVLNEESKRETPSMINFGEKQRFIGCAAADKINMQPKDTIIELKRLIGLKYSDPEVQADIPNFMFPVAQGPNDEIFVTVQYLGKKCTFTPERLVAMVMSDLKNIAEKDHGAKVTDAVVSVPVFFNDAQRRAMLDASAIAGLNVMRLMNETTATALAYGIFKTAEFGDEPTNVVFVDVGHSALQVCVVRFTKSQLKVLATGFDRNLGGRAFDQAMFGHFCAEFMEKQKLDIKTNARASLRLMIAIEKMKKILSANPEANIAIECIMDEKDVKSSMTRDKMEELSQGLLAKLMGPVTTAMSEAGLVPADIKAVELVGNGSRMPFIPAQLEAFFGMVPGRTLNASECVARGCALQGAMLSPQFKVREFEVVDTFPYPVSFSWVGDGGEVKDMELFERNNPVPSSKMMTFFRNETFTLQAKYTTPQLLAPGAALSVGTFDIGPVPAPSANLVVDPEAKDSKTKIKVKVRLNLNGLVSVESAQAVEEIEEDAPVVAVPAPAAAAAAEGDAAMGEGDAAAAGEAAEAAPAPVPEKKKKIKKTDLPVSSTVGGLPAAVIEQFVTEEFEMALQDRVMEETKERKNAVEEFVYGMRQKLAGPLAPYADAAVTESFNTLLGETEDWLYEDGEDETKGVYVAKLEELHKIGDPIKMRSEEESTRPGAVAMLQASGQRFLNMAAPDAAHVHIAAEDLAKVSKDAQAALDWLGDKNTQQEALPKTVDPVLLTADIVKKREALERFANPIMNRAKPFFKDEPAPAVETPAGDESAPMDADEGAADPAAPMAEDLD